MRGEHRLARGAWEGERGGRVKVKVMLLARVLVRVLVR